MVISIQGAISIQVTENAWLYQRSQDLRQKNGKTVLTLPVLDPKDSENNPTPFFCIPRDGKFPFLNKHFRHQFLSLLPKAFWSMHLYVQQDGLSKP